MADFRFTVEPKPEVKPDSLGSSTVIMPDLSSSMSLSSLRLPTPRSATPNLSASHVTAVDPDADETSSVHSDASSFFDVEGVATTTTGSSRSVHEDYDFVSEDEDETGDEL
jgi:hypothetical protein